MYFRTARNYAACWKAYSGYKNTDNCCVKAQFDFTMLQLFAMLSGCIEEENRLMDGCRGKLEEALKKHTAALEDQSGELAGELESVRRYLRKLFTEHFCVLYFPVRNDYG